MVEKRYQVFISSTYDDLQEERRAVQDAVIAMDDFPVQMESFPATDEDQLEFIKPLIAASDYYVLIIAGRYGTITDDGLSYTHKEFRYAVTKGVPVLVLVHEDRGKLASDKSEATDEGRKKLGEFIAEAEAGRIRKTWGTSDGLKLAVREALDHAKRKTPRIGWVRGDTASSVEVLGELNEVRKNNEKLRAQLSLLEVEIPFPEIPDADESFEFDLLPLSETRGGFFRSGSHARVRGTWISLFPVFHANLKWGTNDWSGDYLFYINLEESQAAIGSAVAGVLSAEWTDGLFMIRSGTFDRLRSYYIEAGLMYEEGDRPFSPAAEKLARRKRIAGEEANGFELTSGEIKVSSQKQGQGGFDDEIPF